MTKKPDITLVITNWRRPRHLQRIVADARKQTAKQPIWIWDNSGKLPYDYPVDLLIRSSYNTACGPRWYLAGNAKTELVCVMDDDMTFRDPAILSECAEVLLADPTISVVGAIGKKLLGPSYVKAKKTSGDVDIVLGRFGVYRTAELAEVGMVPFDCTHDDIIISSRIKGRKVIPPKLFARFKQLKTGNESLWKRKSHMSERDKAVVDYFYGGNAEGT